MGREEAYFGSCIEKDSGSPRRMVREGRSWMSQLPGSGEER